MHIPARLGSMPYCLESPGVDENNHLKLLPWRGNSPYMNLKESLWDVLKDKIREVFVTIKTQLIERLIRVWFHYKNIKALCVS